MSDRHEHVKKDIEDFFKWRIETGHMKKTPKDMIPKNMNNYSASLHIKTLAQNMNTSGSDLMHMANMSLTHSLNLSKEDPTKTISKDTREKLQNLMETALFHRISDITVSELTVISQPITDTKPETQH